MSVLSRQHVQAEFPPGKYYLGDLCYVLTPEQWDELMDQAIDGGWGCRDGDFIVEGERIFLGSTHSGDGTYYDNKKNQYSVDSGTIGICPIKLITPELIEYNKNLQLGSILEIKERFKISSDNGIFILNDNFTLFIIIDTSEECEEEE